MKYSIDINLERQILSGWVATDCKNDINGFIELESINGFIIKKIPDAQRNDVLEHNIHKTGKCGFVFSSNEVKKNKIYKININGEKEKINKTIFFGDLSTELKNFNKFEIPRDDNSIMQTPTEELKNSSDNDLILLKKILIRLRRNKRATNFRGKFSGLDYPHKNSDWLFFSETIENHIDFIIKNLNTRYILSVLDTYADFGNKDERVAALAVSNILFQERFAQSLKCIYDFKEKQIPITNKQIYFWDGSMGSNQLNADDSYDVFLTRNLEVLSTTPLIKIFFKEILKRSVNYNDSIIKFNMDNSEHFKEAVSFYIKNIESL